MNPTGGRRYQVASLLGQGAFGSVYRAETHGTELRRQVAIKVLRPEQAAAPGVVERLRDEARMLALIHHRSIVRVDDLVQLDGNWSIVMEFVEGCDVAQLVRHGPLPPRAALAIAEEVANALHAAWNQTGPDGNALHLLHRDIKPSNVRVTASGEIKLLDFGVARADFGGREASTTATAFGTLTYMAPERLEGTDVPAGDVYALGVMLFEMLSGVPPGRNAADPERNPPGKRLAADWARLRDANQDLYDLVVQMIDAEPSERPGTRECARAMALVRSRIEGEAVEDWAARVVPPLLAESRGGELSSESSGTVLVEGTRPTLARQNTTGSAAFIAAGAGIGLAGIALAAGLAIAAGVGIWWWIGTRDRTETEEAAAPSEEEPTQGMEEEAPAATPAKEGPAGAGRTVRAPAARQEAASETAATPIGHVGVEGEVARVVLTGRSGTYGPGEVPAGAWSAEVTFTSGTEVTVRNVVVLAGQTTVLRCNAKFENCSVASE